MKMQTRVQTMALAICALSLSAMPAMAQDNQAAPAAPQGQMEPGGPGGHRGGPAHMEQRQLDMMTRHLKLTNDQVAQIKSIDEAQRTQMMAMRDDTATPREEKRAKMMTLRQDRETKIRAVLTDEQKPKFDEMLAMQKERMDHRRGGPDGAAPPPPPPSL